MKCLGLISWLVDKLGHPVPIDSSIEYDIDEYAEIIGDISVREMAFWSATNLMANAVSKCEFKTYESGKEVKQSNYYRWNVKPNRNQNSSAFIHKMIAQLCRKNECLIIENREDMLVADSFIRTPHALYDDEFTQVLVEDYTFPQTFKQREVIYLTLSEFNIQKVIAGLYTGYSKLIAYSMTSYQRSRGTKAKFNYKSLPVKGTREEELFNSLINEKIKKFLEADNAAIPLGEGQDLEAFGSSKTYSAEGTRDIRAMIDDIYAFTARAFGIPPALMSGDVQGVKDALDQFLTFCIDPLVDMIQEEINGKIYSKSAFLKGDYVKIETGQIKHIDLFSISAPIEKLIGSGAFCVNDILEMVGRPIIDEPWARQHWMTKNYSDIANLLATLEGGEST